MTCSKYLYGLRNKKTGKFYKAHSADADFNNRFTKLTESGMKQCLHSGEYGILKEYDIVKFELKEVGTGSYDIDRNLIEMSDGTIYKGESKVSNNHGHTYFKPDGTKEVWMTTPPDFKLKLVEKTTWNTGK